MPVRASAWRRVAAQLVTGSQLGRWFVAALPESKESLFFTLGTRLPGRQDPDLPEFAYAWQTPGVWGVYQAGVVRGDPASRRASGGSSWRKGFLMTESKVATINDVAALAGVSISTVSKAVNGRSGLSQ